MQFGACSVLPSNDASTDVAGSFSECDENAAEVECESPQTEPDGVLELQRKIELLETQLADRQEKLSEEGKEHRSYWNVNFPSTSFFHQHIFHLFYFTLDSQVMRHK